MTQTDSKSPVTLIPADDPAQPLRDPSQIALCLSGGGYRAMLFHLGALWRLNELGQLPVLDRITSVSGGSIIAGALALAWPKLNFDPIGVARAFDGEVVAPVRRMAGVTIDTPSIVKGLLGAGT